MCGSSFLILLTATNAVLCIHIYPQTAPFQMTIKHCQMVIGLGTNCLVKRLMCTHVLCLLQIIGRAAHCNPALDMLRDEDGMPYGIMLGHTQDLIVLRSYPMFAAALFANLKVSQAIANGSYLHAMGDINMPQLVEFRVGHASNNVSRSVKKSGNFMSPEQLKEALGSEAPSYADYCRELKLLVDSRVGTVSLEEQEVGSQSCSLVIHQVVHVAAHN